MRQLVTEYIKTCTTCQAVQTPSKKFQPLLTPSPKYDLLTRWSSDVKGPNRLRSGETRYILVCVECFSNYLELIPLADTTSETIASSIYNNIVLRHG